MDRRLFGQATFGVILAMIGCHSVMADGGNVTQSQLGIRNTIQQIQFAPSDLQPAVPDATVEADMSPEADGTSDAELVPVPKPESLGNMPSPADDQNWLVDDNGTVIGDPIADQSVSVEGLTVGGGCEHCGGTLAGCENCASAAPVFGSGTWFRKGTWYSKIDFVMLLQSKPSGGNFPNRSFLLRNSGFIRPSGIIGLDNDFDSPFSLDSSSPRFEPGMRLTVGRILGRDGGKRDHVVEVSYFGLHEWDAASGIQSRGPNGATLLTLLGGVQIIQNTVTPVSVIGFTGNDEQDFVYESDLTNVEVNFRLQGRPASDSIAMQPDGSWVRHEASSNVLSLLAGIRYTSINDAFRLNGTNFPRSADLLGTPFDDSLGIRGHYDVLTHNDMIGVHFGGEWLDKHSAWYWGIRTRVGGLVNFADRQSRVDLTTFDGSQRLGGSPDEFVDDENLVFLAEAGLVLAYQLRPYLTVRAGYDWRYFTGIAEATKNLQLPDPPAFNVEGSRLYQGVSIGIERFW